MLALRPAALAIVALLALPAAASAAGTWNPESYLAVGLQEASGPSIAVAADGGAVAGWQQNQPRVRERRRGPDRAGARDRAVRHRRDAPGGRLGARARSRATCAMTTAVNSSGKAVVAWVQAGVRRAASACRPPCVPPAPRASARCRRSRRRARTRPCPLSRSNDAGAAVLVWRRHDSASESWEVQGAVAERRRHDSSPRSRRRTSPTSRTTTSTTRSPRRCSVAIAPSGGAVVVWESTGEHRGRPRRGGRAWAAAGVHDLGAGTHFADVAAGADGSFALTWVTGSGGTGADAWLARATTGGFGIAVPVGSHRRRRSSPRASRSTARATRSWR